MSPHAAPNILVAFLHLILLTAVLPHSAFSQVSGTATLGGLVVIDGGLPVSEAEVTFIRLGACRPTPSGGVQCDLPTGYRTQTASDGRFLVTNLPAGDYQNFCAHPVQPTQIASCLWRDFGDAGDYGRRTLTDGQIISDLRLILQTGVLLKFEIEDEARFIDRGVFFRLSVLDSSRLVVNTTQLVHGNPAVFSTAVPPGVSTQIDLETSLVVYDETGQSIPMQKFSLPVSVGSSETVVRWKAVPAVVNAASFWPALPIGGGIASLFGLGLTNVHGILTADRVPLPTELAGTTVTVQGIPVPLFAVANIGGQEQINFQAPSVGSAEIIVNNNGAQKRLYTLGIVTPGIFVNDGQPAIQHGADFSPIFPGNPARRGEPIVIYATGFWLTTPDVPLGFAAPVGTLTTCRITPQVHIGETIAKLLFCGRAPGFVGLDQVNVEVPTDTPSGLAELVINQNGVASNTVLLPVE